MDYDEQIMLWDKLFDGEWAEIIVATVSPAGRQIIGCLIPMDDKISGEVSVLAEEYNEEEQVDVAIVTKPFGKRNRPCLSLVHHFSGIHLSQVELAHAAQNLRNQVFLLTGMPVMLTRRISQKEALARLT